MKEIHASPNCEKRGEKIMRKRITKVIQKNGRREFVRVRKRERKMEERKAVSKLHGRDGGFRKICCWGGIHEGWNVCKFTRAQKVNRR